MKRSLITIFSIATLFFIVGGTPVEAACPAPAYYNSYGQCVRDVYTYTLPQATPYSTYQFPHQYLNTYTYNSYSSTNAAQIAMLQAYVQQLQQLLLALQAGQGSTGGTNTPSTPTGNSRVDVETDNAENVTDERATLVGEVDFNREDEAVVYFEWGRSQNDLSKKTIEIVLDEDDDDETFKIRIDNLLEDTRYYFRAVAEDEQGRKAYGRIEDFRTDDDRRNSRDDDEPDVDLDEADDVTDDSAEFDGEVDMNDFRNGRVFVVFGEDEDQIEDIAREYDTYNEIDEDGDDLQKFSIDSDLDGDSDYTIELDNLDDDTRYYVSLCVAFEDEDDDDTIICSDVVDFRTED